MTDGFDPKSFFELARSVGHGRALGLEFRAVGDNWVELALPWREQLVGVTETGILASGAIVIENVAVPLRLTGLGRRESTERADSLLQELGLGHYLSHRPGQLSGGQQQRVAVARALATNPSLVLADEPTAHLDGSSVDDVSALLRSIAASGRTVIVATHDDRLLPMVDQQIHL